MDDQDLLKEFQSLLEQQRQAHQEMFKQIETKGVADPESRAKIEKLEQALTKTHDEYTAEQTKQREAIRVLEEKAGRLPAKVNGTTSLGKQFVESDTFKAEAFTGRFHMHTTLKGSFSTKAASNIITDAAYPLPPRTMFVPSVLVPGERPTVVRDLFPQTPTTASAIEYAQETWTFQADYQVTQGTTKAQSLVDYADKIANVRTIAHYVKVSRQMAADVPSLMATIDNRLAYGVRLKEDTELLYGSGATGHLTGVMTAATALSGTLPTGATAIDQILAAMVQVTASGHMPTDVVLPATGWGAIMGLKNSQGTYLYGTPLNAVQPRIWGLPVTVSLSMAATDFLVGAFPDCAEIFDRETVTVDIAFENEDDFIKNLITLRGEERLALAIYVPAAFVKGTLIAPTMLEAEAKAAPKKA
jgi:HK97 family phage major capsid protein